MLLPLDFETVKAGPVFLCAKVVFAQNLQLHLQRGVFGEDGPI